MTVWKYVIDGSHSYQSGTVIIPMAKGARIVSVGEQQRQVCLWALVPATRPSIAPVQRRFRIVMTGEHFDLDMNDTVYLGRVTIGVLELHVLEEA